MNMLVPVLLAIFAISTVIISIFTIPVVIFSIFFISTSVLPVFTIPIVPSSISIVHFYCLLSGCWEVIVKD